MQRIGGAEVVGPILLGMAKPVHVLARGASSEGVYNMASYTCLEASGKSEDE